MVVKTSWMLDAFLNNGAALHTIRRWKGWCRRNWIVKPSTVRGQSVHVARLPCQRRGWREEGFGRGGESRAGACYKAISEEREGGFGELDSVNAKPGKRKRWRGELCIVLRASLRWVIEEEQPRNLVTE